MREAIRQVIDFFRIVLLASLFLGLSTYYLLVVQEHKYFLYGLALVLGLISLLAIVLVKSVFVDKSPARRVMLAILLNSLIAVAIMFIVFMLPLFGLDYATLPNKLVAVVAIFFGARALSKLKPGFIL